MSEKKKSKNLMTPVGIAKFPHLNEPNRKFKEEGVFSINVILPPDKGQELLEQLTAMSDEHYNSWFNSAKPKERKEYTRAYSFGPEYDSDGNDTGNLEFRFSSNATMKDKATGEIKAWFPRFADKFGQVLKHDELPAIYGGSKVRVSFMPSPYVTGGKVGIKLFLNGVQIVKLSDYTPGSGFGAVEDEDDDDGDNTFPSTAPASSQEKGEDDAGDF